VEGRDEDERRIHMKLKTQIQAGPAVRYSGKGY
jgi:hypothetical protein